MPLSEQWAQTNRKTEFSEASVLAADTLSAGVAREGPGSVPSDHRAGFKTVDSAAIGAAGGAGMGQIEKDPGMAAPRSHARVGAVGRQIGCVEFDDRIATGGSRQIAGMASLITHIG